MSRVCTVCEAKNRINIDRAIVSGASIASISREFGVSEAAITNHRDNHISRQMAKAAEMKNVENGLDLFQRAENLMVTLETLLQTAKTKNQDQKLLSVSRELRGVYEMLAKFQYVASQQNGEGGYLTDGEKRDKRAQHEYNERLSADIEKNLDNLTEEEKSAYHQIIIKLINGHKNRIKYIHYNDNGNIPVHDFKDTTEYKANVTDDEDEPSQPMRRTKAPKQEDPFDYVPQSVEIPFTPFKDNPLNPLRRRR